MNENIVTGVFADKDAAAQAVADIRSLNYPQEAIDVSGHPPTLIVRVRAGAGDEDQLQRILGTRENGREDAVMSADDTGMIREERLILESDLAQAEIEGP